MQTRSEAEKMDRSTLKMYLLLTFPFILCRLLDIYSTELILSTGGFEANPVAAYLMTMIGVYNTYAFTLFVMAMIGMFTLQIWRWCKVIGSHLRSVMASKITFAVIYAVLILQNMLPFVLNMALYNNMSVM